MRERAGAHNLTRTVPNHYQSISRPLKNGQFQLKQTRESKKLRGFDSPLSWPKVCPLR